jgi:hypothetical protein
MAFMVFALRYLIMLRLFSDPGWQTRFVFGITEILKATPTRWVLRGCFWEAASIWLSDFICRSLRNDGAHVLRSPRCINSLRSGHCGQTPHGRIVFATCKDGDIETQMENIPIHQNWSC